MTTREKRHKPSLPTQTVDRGFSKSINPALLLDIFDEPIVFHRAYVPITGSALAALFLSYAVYSTEHLPLEADGWFKKSSEEWLKETGMTRFEQQSARRILRDKGILIERRYGLPAELWFKVRTDFLLELMSDEANTRWGDSLPANEHS